MGNYSKRKLEMRYVYFEFDGEKFCIEIDGSHTALRQIIEDKNGQVLVSCRDGCLAEGDVQNAMYPGCRLSGVVSGYDDINFWVLIADGHAE